MPQASGLVCGSWAAPDLSVEAAAPRQGGFSCVAFWSGGERERMFAPLLSSGIRK